MEDKKSFWEIVVEKGRIAQWIVCGGACLVCLCGGFGGWLEGETIKDIIIYSILAGFGLEQMAKKD